MERNGDYIDMDILSDKEGAKAEATKAVRRVCPVRNVKVRMTMEERIKFKCPRGVDAFFYGPDPDPKRRLPDDVCYATFYCAKVTPHREEQRYEDDLDELLANLGRKLLSDKVTKAQCPNLLEAPTVNMRTLVDSPLLDNDYDTQIRSRMKNVTKIPIPQSHLLAINARLKRYGILYSSPRKELLPKDMEEQEQRDPGTGEKIYMARFGDV